MLRARTSKRKTQTTHQKIMKISMLVLALIAASVSIASATTQVGNWAYCNGEGYCKGTCYYSDSTGGTYHQGNGCTTTADGCDCPR